MRVPVGRLIIVNVRTPTFVSTITRTTTTYIPRRSLTKLQACVQRRTALRGSLEWRPVGSLGEGTTQPASRRVGRVDIAAIWRTMVSPTKRDDPRIDG